MPRLQFICIEQPHNHTIEMVVLSTDIVYNAQMNDIYQEHILDHANNPRNKTLVRRGISPRLTPRFREEPLINTDAHDTDKHICGQGDNPSCGDEGEMCVEISHPPAPSPREGEEIQVYPGVAPFPLGRAGDGTIQNVQWSGRGCAISQASMSMMSELLIGKNIKELKLMMPGDVYQMLGIQITPSRVNCALLSYRALENILSKIIHI